MHTIVAFLQMYLFATKCTWKAVLRLVFEVIYEFLLTFSKMFALIIILNVSKNLSSRLEDGKYAKYAQWLVVRGISIKE